MKKKTLKKPPSCLKRFFFQLSPASAGSRAVCQKAASGASGIGWLRLRWWCNATCSCVAGGWDVEMWKYRRVNKCVFFWGGLSVKSDWYRFSSYPGLTQGQCRLLITRWATHLALIHLRTQRPAMRIIVICHEEKGWWECWELGDGQQGPSISSGDATLPSK